jgi:hypothetical protein
MRVYVVVIERMERIKWSREGNNNREGMEGR